MNPESPEAAPRKTSDAGASPTGAPAHVPPRDVRAHPDGKPGSSAWRSSRAWVILLLAVVLSLVIDLGSKVVAFERVAGTPVRVERRHVLEVSASDPRMVTTLVPQHTPRVVVPELLHVTLVLNPGAVFGIGPGKRLFFVGFTLLALAFGLGMFSLWTSARDHWAHAGIGLLIGGGLGNLYDRLVYGCVRDFLHPLPGWEWPNGWRLLGSTEVWPYVSNMADLFLLIGIVILMVHLWRRDKAAGNTEPRAA